MRATFKLLLLCFCSILLLSSLGTLSSPSGFTVAPVRSCFLTVDVVVFGGDLYVSPEGKPTADCSRQSPCSLLHAMAVAQSRDSIILLEGSYLFTQPISITKSVSVKADQTSSARVALSGSSTAFELSCTDCSIQGIKFTNFTVPAMIVSVSAAVNFSSCSFEANILLGQTTGVVFVQGSVYFHSCNFIKNSLQSAEQDQVAGAAVTIRPNCAPGSISTEFHDCIFQENVVRSEHRTPDSAGGAISYLEPKCDLEAPAGTRTLTISNSQFVDNIVICASVERGRHTRSFLSTGGAVDIHSIPSLNVSITRSSFFGSEILSPTSVMQGVSVEGGAVSIALADAASSILIDTCHFESNSAIAGQYPITSDSTIGGYCYGGALSISASVVATISRCNFTRNSCTGGVGSALSGRTFGGAFAYRTYERSTVDLPDQDRNVGVVLSESFFGENFAISLPILTNPAGGAAAGGAAFVWFSFASQSTTVCVCNCMLVKNSVTGTISADSNGGALALVWDVRAAASTIIENSIFKENYVVGSESSSSPSDFSARGGAVSIVTKLSIPSHVPLFSKVSFVRNAAKAAACIKEIATCFLGGNAVGGAVSAYLDGVDLPSFSSSGIFRNCYFEGNSVSVGSLVQSRTKSASGGAIWWKMSTNAVEIIKCKFVQNYALVPPLAGHQSSDTAGEGVDAHCSGGAATLKDGVRLHSSTFESNGAGRLLRTLDGVDSSTIVVEGGTISAAVSFSAEDSEFFNNTVVATLISGHIANVDGAQIQVMRSAFVQNTAFCSAFGAGGLYWGTGLPDIVDSTFSNNSMRSRSSLALSGYGADIAGKFFSTSSLRNCTFTGSQAAFGGSVAFSFEGEVPVSGFQQSTWTKCAATGGGATWILSAPSSAFESIIATFHNATIFKFESNSATYGPDFSSNYVTLQFVQGPPQISWPSQPFRMLVGLFDMFGQLTSHPEVTLTINATTDASGWHAPPFILSGITSEGVIRGKDNLYEFDAVELTTPPGSHTMIHITTSNPTISEPLSSPGQGILVATCPPGYTSFQAIDAYGCRRCANNQFNLDGNSTCEECPESEIPGLYQCFSPPNLQTNAQNEEHLLSSDHLEGDESRVLSWIIHRGFFPVPSFVSPKDLLPCYNPEACLQYNCTLGYNGTAPILDCSHCEGEEEEHRNHNGSAGQQKSCLCEAGYSGRLCSMCHCDEKECYFSSDNEEHECHKCQSNSSWLLVVAVIVLQLSMIAFLIFHRSAASLFLTEFVLVVILMILGIGETWLFQVVCVMALMFLLSAAENRRKVRADAHHMHGDHAHHAEHLTAAKMTGIVKVILFFLQTVPAVVPHEAWPEWVGSIVRLLSAMSLRLSGLECVSPALFSSPIGRFSFVMSLPVLFSLSIGVSVIFAALITWSGVIQKVKIAYLRCCRKRRRAKEEEKGILASEEDSKDHEQPSVPEFSSMCSSESESDFTVVEHPPEPESAALLGHNENYHHVQISDRRPLSFSQRVITRIQFSVLFILFAGHFELSNTVLAVLRPCEHGYMQSYPFIKCSWTEDPRYLVLYVLALIFLVAYLLGIPTLFGFFLLRHRKHIKEGAEYADDRIGFLYETFRREVYWFEMVWIARRVLVSLIITLIPLSSGLQVAAMTIVLLTFLIVQRAVMPFSSKLVNYLELLASFVTLYSYIVGTEIASHFELFNERQPVKIVIQSVLWILNAVVVVVLVFALVQPSVARTIKSIRNACCSPQGYEAE